MLHRLAGCAGEREQKQSSDFPAFFGPAPTARADAAPVRPGASALLLRVHWLLGPSFHELLARRHYTGQQ